MLCPFRKNTLSGSAEATFIYPSPTKRGEIQEAGSTTLDFRFRQDDPTSTRRSRRYLPIAAISVLTEISRFSQNTIWPANSAIGGIRSRPRLERWHKNVVVLGGHPDD